MSDFCSKIFEKIKNFGGAEGAAENFLTFFSSDRLTSRGG